MARHSLHETSRKCNNCLITKSRLPVDPTATGKASTRFRFKSEDGKLWRGTICGCCANKLKADQVRKQTDPTPKRNCRVCCKPLPRTLYFYHILCRSEEFKHFEEEFLYVG